MSKELMEKIFKRLPISEREMPAFIIDNKVLTWKEAWLQVKSDGPLAKKILKKIEVYKK